MQFCGNAMLNDHLVVADTQCSIACAGNPAEMCGGLDAMNVYHVGDNSFTSGPAAIPPAMGDWTFFACSQFVALTELCWKYRLTASAERPPAVPVRSPRP